MSKSCSLLKHAAEGARRSEQQTFRVASGSTPWYSPAMRPIALASLVTALLATACDESSGSNDGGAQSTGGAASGGSGGQGGAQACDPGEVLACFTGLPEQADVGLCKSGEQVCNEDGLGFGPCEAQVLPKAETCKNPGDEDCDGLVDEDGTDCDCEPGSEKACYGGPNATKDVGACQGGTQTCNASGTGYGSCVGQVVPKAETCNTPADDDCDGQTNEAGVGCVCPPGEVVACYSGPPATKDVGNCSSGTGTCNAQGTAIEACSGDVLPTLEPCLSAADADCDGLVQELSDCACTAGSTLNCYSGAPATEDVGLCQGGLRTCDGSGYGGCIGEVTPVAENCSTASDDDCDGNVLDGCTCVPGSVEACYTGPAGSQNQGICLPGSRTCNANGLGWGACMGQTLPALEQCFNMVDEDCDGTADEAVWASRTVKINAPGPHLELAVAGGTVYALYHNTFFNDLVLSEATAGGGFVDTTIDINAPGPTPRLVVDGAGGVHVLYHDTFFDDLVYAYRPAGGVFTDTIVDNNAPGPEPVLIVDASQRVHILYHDTFFNDVDYATKPAGGVFTTATIDVSAPGPGLAMAVDAAGGVHAAYRDTFFDDTDYAYKPAGGAFTQTTITSTSSGDRPQLAVDALGAVHVVFEDAALTNLVYAHKPAGGAFALTIIDSNEPGTHPALVVDSLQGVHVLYHDLFFDDLDYAYKPAGGSFSLVTVDSSEPASVPRLAVDSTFGVHAFYRDGFFDDLNYAYRPAGGQFNATTVTTTTTGADTAFVVDTQGGLHALAHNTFFDDVDYFSRCP